jgi:hypothetical protein
MKHPPYHLRLNKAADRFSFMEAIGRLSGIGDLSEYTYYSLGGPYLEDFRMVYEFHPQISMVSIEKDEETYKRQKFHLPCGVVDLRNEEFASFLAQYDANDQPSIFWLDYTGLEFGHFENFKVLLEKVAAGSMVKLTVQSDPRRFKSEQSFRLKFDSVMPTSSSIWPSTSNGCSILVQEMAQIAAQQALPAEMPNVFQLVSSFYYSDGTNMLTLVGVVCARGDRNKVRDSFGRLKFANLDWNPPQNIDLPALSTKERLHIQHLLPGGPGAGRTIRESLGYLIDTDVETTEARLNQYADFHRYFPYFLKATP